VALALAAAFILLIVWAISAIGGGGGGSANAGGDPAELPRGGRVIFPHYRVVSYYGAPQDQELGVLGIGTPAEAAKKLLAQARPYDNPRRPVLPAFELISTIAQAAPGGDGMHRLRQTDATIRGYLKAVRQVKGLLILDIQPGQAPFIDEVKALEPYLSQPDVGLALDSEWSLPTGHLPGKEIGSTDAATINQVSAYLSALGKRLKLPEKLLIVHQFTDEMVKNRKLVAARPNLAIVSNIDGFGTPPLKTAIYRRLAEARAVPGRRSGYNNGLKLFYQEDTDLMNPANVLKLRPQPDVIVYE
jgi:hypothetical protein